MKLIDTNRFWMTPEHRFIHVASIQQNLREFVVMLDVKTNNSYIEEITGGHLKTIDDDNLFNDLFNFIHERNLLTVHVDAPIEEQPFSINKK